MFFHESFYQPGMDVMTLDNEIMLVVRFFDYEQLYRWPDGFCLGYICTGYLKGSIASIHLVIALSGPFPQYVLWKEFRVAVSGDISRNNSFERIARNPRYVHFFSQLLG